MNELFRPTMNSSERQNGSDNNMSPSYIMKPYRVSVASSVPSVVTGGLMGVWVDVTRGKAVRSIGWG